MNIKFLTKWPLAALLATVMLTGCTKEDETDCLGDVSLTFRFTRDGQDNFGPQVPSLSVFVFDEAGIFLGRWDEDDNTLFGAEYTMTLPLAPGTYSFVAWGGLNDTQYYLCSPDETHGGATGPEIGRTHIDDMLVRVACNHSSEVPFIPANQFHGEVVNQAVNAGKDNDITIDLVKNSSQIRLTILGLPLPTTRANPYTQMSLWFDAANGGYDFHNGMEQDGETMCYLEQGKDGGADGSLVASFHTLQLKMRDSGGSSLPYKYTLWNSETGAAYHTADLVHDYISKVAVYDTQSKIDAEDLFDISIDLNPYVGVTVTVNGWKVDTTGSTIQ